MRLIDADKFLKEILTAGIGKTIIEYSESDIGYMIRRQPTVDAAEVLREQWISVEDRLPELIPCSAGTGYSEAVVVLTSGKKAMIAIWDGVDFICAVALKAIFNHAVVNRGYSLYFVKDNLSIPHEQLKEFMPQNNMK